MPCIKSATIKSGIVNVVNPRLGRYTNATVIAICVMVTNIAFIFGYTAYLNSPSQCSVTTTVERSRPVVLGEHRDHLSFIEDTSGLTSDPPRGPGVEVETSSGRVTTTRRTDVCVQSTRAIFTKYLWGDMKYYDPDVLADDPDSVPQTMPIHSHLEYKPCTAEWMQCHPNYPYDNNSIITRRNQPCMQGHGSIGPTRSKIWPAVKWCGDLAEAEELRNAHQTCFLGAKSVAVDVSLWASVMEAERGMGLHQHMSHEEELEHRWCDNDMCLAGVVNDKGQYDHGCKDNIPPPDEPDKAYHPKDVDVGPADHYGRDVWWMNLCGYRSGASKPWGKVAVPPFSTDKAVPYEVTYNVTDYKSVQTCPGFLQSFNLAIGLVSNIELVATAMFLAVFTVLGLTSLKDSPGKGIRSSAVGIMSSAAGSSPDSNYKAILELQEAMVELQKLQKVELTPVQKLAE